jgi:hypothetical protein
MRLLLTYDLIAGSGALTPEEEADIEHILVYSAHFLAHPDYWNPDVGLGNSLPNMTSSIRLPLGLLALYLHGHPASAGWLRGAETEIQYEFAHWVSPGGAWIENLQYQSASLDGIFLLAQALKNVTGRDYFADANFKATMDYFGWVLTPPDPQFPPAPWKTAATPSPMTLPALGDGMLGYITAFNGWMAAATAATDPAYSAQQQFFWQGQQQYLGISETARGNDSSGRAKSFTMALMNPELPAAPPTALAKAFPDFGSVMRSSWTDPRASYLLHRVGKQAIHTHMEENSIVYYAKGAPLCLDPGNGPGATAGSQPPWLHNLVSFDTPRAPVVYGPMHGNGTLRELRALGRIVDYSNGESRGAGNQQNLRHLLLVKSDDPLGAIYVVMRDATVDGQANQAFYWNLWCLGREPRIDGTVVHFPGQYGVDLDVHVLAPAQPVINRDHWEWKPGYVYVWGRIDPVLHGVHVQKQGSKEDFFTVLYPRAAGQAAAEVTILAGGAAARVAHMEGVDLVLLSPGKVATAEADGMGMDGEIALARRYTDGRLRLAILKGHAQSAVTIDGWGLASAEPAAIEVHGNTITGESNGAVHVIKIALPPGKKLVTLALDGKGTTGSRNDISYELAVPAGHHSFRLTVE